MKGYSYVKQTVSNKVIINRCNIKERKVKYINYILHQYVKHISINLTIIQSYKMECKDILLVDKAIIGFK